MYHFFKAIVQKQRKNLRLYSGAKEEKGGPVAKDGSSMGPTGWRSREQLCSRKRLRDSMLEAAKLNPKDGHKSFKVVFKSVCLLESSGELLTLPKPSLDSRRSKSGFLGMGPRYQCFNRSPGDSMGRLI